MFSLKNYHHQFVLSLIFMMAASGHLVGQEQEFKSFKLVERELIWQQVYDSAVSDKDCLSFFEQLSTTSNPRASDDYLLFDVQDLRIDYLKYGETLGSTPSVISEYAVSGKLKIEMKKDRYRVTFYGIQLTSIVHNPSLIVHSDFGYQMLKNKRDKIRRSAASQDVLGLYHKFFFDYFHVKKSIHGRDDW